MLYSTLCVLVHRKSLYSMNLLPAGPRQWWVELPVQSWGVSLSSLSDHDGHTHTLDQALRREEDGGSFRGGEKREMKEVTCEGSIICML